MTFGRRLLVAIAEMALAGDIGVELFAYEGRFPAHAIWFGEDQGRYVWSGDPRMAEVVLERARLLALPRGSSAAPAGSDRPQGRGALPLVDLA